jgi:hypothetical protein
VDDAYIYIYYLKDVSLYNVMDPIINQVQVFCPL